MNSQQLSRGLGFFSIALGLAELIAPAKVARTIGVKDDHATLLRLLGVREISSGLGLIAQPREKGWRWSRVAGDLMDLGLLGTAFASARTDRRRLAIATAVVAGVTALDVLASVEPRRRPRIDPSWRYTPAGGRAGIDRKKLAESPLPRMAHELVDRPLRPAPETRLG